MAVTLSRAAAWLARYFRVPSRSGFSPYRTGWAAHLAFSALAATGIYQVAARQLGMSVPSALALTLGGVWLLWGVGVTVGVRSHYSPALTLCPFVVLFAGAAIWPRLLLGFGVAAVAHAFIGMISVLPKWVSGRARGARADGRHA